MAPLVAFRDLKALLLTLVVARCEWLVTAAGIFPPSPPALNLNGRDEDARLSKIAEIPERPGMVSFGECNVRMEKALDFSTAALTNQWTAPAASLSWTLPRHILKFLVETAIPIPAYLVIGSYQLIARRPSEKVPRPRINSQSIF